MTDTNVDLSTYLNDQFKHGTVPLDPGLEIRLLECPDHVSVIQPLDLIIELGKAPSNPQTDHEVKFPDNSLNAIIDLVDALREFDGLSCFQQISRDQLITIFEKIKARPQRLLEFLGRQDLRPKLYSLIWKGAKKSDLLSEEKDSSIKSPNYRPLVQTHDFIENEYWLKKIVAEFRAFLKGNQGGEVGKRVRYVP